MSEKFHIFFSKIFFRGIFLEGVGRLVGLYVVWWGFQNLEETKLKYPAPIAFHAASTLPWDYNNNSYLCKINSNSHLFGFTTLHTQFIKACCSVSWGKNKFLFNIMFIIRQMFESLIGLCLFVFIFVCVCSIMITQSPIFSSSSAVVINTILCHTYCHALKY